MLLEPEAIAAAYAGTRRRTTDLLRAASADIVDQPVPACPEWTVTQLAAHVCGVCDDVLAGNIEAAGTDPWTAAQVEAFADRSLGEILDHWDEVGASIEAMLPVFPPLAASQMVFDATTHEHDLRGALDEPGARDSDGILAGLGFLLTSLDQGIRERGLPPLAISAEGHEWQLGAGDPEVRLSASLFDVFRTWGGRRTFDQIHALDWQGDPSPYLAFSDGRIHPPAEPVEH